jgi:rubrerythrin
MKTYVCRYCRYKTTRESKPDTCNYCGKSEGLAEVSNAEKLLDEV